MRWGSQVLDSALQPRRLRNGNTEGPWQQLLLLLPMLLLLLLQIMYLMAMEQFMYHTKKTGNYAYYAIAAIHGVHLEYNKQTPPGEQG
jgi:hypothetical protein